MRAAARRLERTYHPCRPGSLSRPRPSACPYAPKGLEGFSPKFTVIEEEWAHPNGAVCFSVCIYEQAHSNLNASVSTL